MKDIIATLKCEDPMILARARAILAVYHEKWHAVWGDYEILDVEREFAFPLLNPETMAPSRSFDEGGKLDVLTRHRPTKLIKVIEHKTTGDSVAPDSDYWDRLRMDTQVSKYFLAAAQLGIGDVSSVLYDVMRKPGQRPSAIPLRDDKGLKIVLDATGKRVMTKDGKKPRETADAEQGYVLQTRPETPVEFEVRLLTVLRAEPDAYFAQREAPRLDRDLLEYMHDAWAVSQQLLHFRKTNCWSRNTDACKEFGTCEMFDLCVGRASVDGVRYRVRPNAHPELKIQAGQGGKQLLTTSRTKAFNRCRRYHSLSYEQMIERVDGDREPLVLGTLVHLGLESYFKSMIKPQSTN